MRRPILLLGLLALLSPVALAELGDGSDPARDEVVNIHVLGDSPPLVGDLCSVPSGDLVATGAESTKTSLRLWLRVRDFDAPATCPWTKEFPSLRAWWGDMLAYHGDVSYDRMLHVDFGHNLHGAWANVAIVLPSRGGIALCDVPAFATSLDGDELSVTLPLAGETSCGAGYSYDLAGLDYRFEGSVEVRGHFQTPSTSYVSYDRTWDAPPHALRNLTNNA